MTARHNVRLLGWLAVLATIALAVGLISFALQQNINLFFSPQQILAGEAPTAKVIRLGGWVKLGTIKRKLDLSVNFTLTDNQGHEVPVSYQGLLPDLFREQEGVVALGTLQQGSGGLTFKAKQILAKHGENYQPPELQRMAETQS